MAKTAKNIKMARGGMGKRKMPKKVKPHWEVMSDDSFNKTLKLIIIKNMLVK